MLTGTQSNMKVDQNNMKPVDDLANEINGWKAKYGEHNVHQADIESDEGILTYIIRKPGRKEIDAMAHHKSNNDVTKANNVLISNCILHGDKDIIERDGDVYAEVLLKISALVKKRESAIKKL
jgi:hypothetical protein